MGVNTIDRTLIKYFTVKWTALVSIIDGIADEDDEPDLDTLTGVITLTPKLGGPLKFMDTPEPFTIVPMARRVNVTAGELNDQSRKYIKLEAATTNAAPSSWNWEANFDLSYKGTPIRISAFQFMGEPNGVVDFSDEIPIKDIVSGIEYARGPRGFSFNNITLTGASYDTLNFYRDDPSNTLVKSVTLPQLTQAFDAAAIAVTAAELAENDKDSANLSKISAAASAAAAEAAKILAQTYRNDSEGFKNTATTQAGIATTKAAEAAASAAAAADAVLGNIPNGSIRNIKFYNRDMSNLMAAGDLEGDITTDIDVAPTFTWSYDTTRFYEGSRSIRITSLGGEMRGKPIPTSPGEAFLFGIMWRVDALLTGPGGLRIQANVGGTWTDVTASKSSVADVSGVSAANTWTRGTMLSVMPAGATQVRWRMAFALTGTNSGMNIDDLDFRRVPEILAPLSVVTNDLADGSVTSVKIADGTVTNADISASAGIVGSKLANGTIGSTQITDLGIATIDIADLAITLAKLAANSVDSSKIVDGTIVNADISSTAGIAGTKLASLGVGSGQIADLAIITAKLADLGVTTAKIADANITLAKMAADSVDSTKIVNGSVALVDLASESKTEGMNYEHTVSGARATGLGDLGAEGWVCPYAITFTALQVRGGTADASGTTTVQMLKNGSSTGMPAAQSFVAPAVSSTEVNGTWSFAKGDILSFNCTAVGTTPGNKLKAILAGVKA